MNVIRGSVARIQAVGELFLMFTKVLADILHQKRVQAEDILRIENQAKVVNEFSAYYFDSFCAHIHELEDVLMSFASIGGHIKVVEDAARQHELDNARAKVHASAAVQEIAVAKLEMQAADDAKRARALEAGLEDLATQLKNAKVAQAAAEVAAKEAAFNAKKESQNALEAEAELQRLVSQDDARKRSSSDMKAHLDECHQPMDKDAALLQRQLEDISKLTKIVKSFSEKGLRR